MSPCWSYSGETGCGRWGELGFPLAKCGKQQSPININTRLCKEQCCGTQLSIKTSPTFSSSIKNTGFTAKVELDEKVQHIEIEGELFGLVQFHFHSPTEHTVNEQYFPLELHLVHESMKTRGKLAVIAVLFEESQIESEFLNNVLPLIPRDVNKPVRVTQPLNLDGLNITDKYWNYAGSLTTPPCTEGVTWIVLKETHPATSQQLQQYLKFFPLDTNRPIQPTYDRIISSY